MKIAIIGAGNIGGNLTRRLTALGHEVSVANSRGPQTLSDLAAETGATALPVEQVATDAEVVVVAVPMVSVPRLPAGLLDAVADGAVVVDTGNYYPQRDGRLAEVEAGLTESEWVAAQLGHPVVKAFNNVFASQLLSRGRPPGDPERAAVPVAGNDPEAKQVVLALVDELGFDAVDAGPLDQSWRQQPGTAVYGTDLPADQLVAALAQASPERTAAWRA
jgi:hypothetical protein